VAMKGCAEGSQFQRNIAAAARESKRNFCLFSDFFYFIAIARRVYDDGSTAGSGFNFAFFFVISDV
jgi:hypothetical protein